MTLDQRFSQTPMPAMAVNAILFLAPALALATPKSTVYGSLLLSILGLIERWRTRAQARPPLPDPLKALILFALITLTLGIYHRDLWGTFHLPIAILLCIPGYWAFNTRGVQVHWVLLGSALGAVLGAVLAIQQGGLQGVRAGGVFNPIPFGGIALVLASACMVALLVTPAWITRPAWLAFHACGMAGGLMASVLSGSKAGWLAIPGLLVVFWIMWRRQPALPKRRYTWVVGAAMLGVFVLVAQTSMVPRALLTMQTMKDYASTGEASDDGSLAPRLVLWRYGVSRIPQAPLLGIGKRAMLEDMSEAAAAGEFESTLGRWHTLHNEFLHITAVNGVIGLASLVLVYAALWRLGWRGRRSADPMAWLAMLLVIVYLALGVGEVAVQLKDLRNFFLFWVVVITGLAATKDARPANP